MSRRGLPVAEALGDVDPAELRERVLALGVPLTWDIDWHPPSAAPADEPDERKHSTLGVMHRMTQAKVEHRERQRERVAARRQLERKLQARYIHLLDFTVKHEQSWEKSANVPPGGWFQKLDRVDTSKDLVKKVTTFREPTKHDPRIHEFGWQRPEADRGFPRPSPYELKPKSRANFIGSLTGSVHQIHAEWDAAPAYSISQANRKAQLGAELDEMQRCLDHMQGANNKPRPQIKTMRMHWEQEQAKTLAMPGNGLSRSAKGRASTTRRFGKTSNPFASSEVKVHPHTIGGGDQREREFRGARSPPRPKTSNAPPSARRASSRAKLGRPSSV